MKVGARLLRSVFWYAAVVLPYVYAQQPGSVFLKGPYLQGPSSNVMTIKWEAPLDGGAVLRYGLNGKLDQEMTLKPARSQTVHTANSATDTDQSGANTNETTVYLYEAALTNLRPASVYTYSAELGSVRTPPKKFRTLPADESKVTFIAYGDVRTNPKTHSAVVANFKRYSPDFILHTGDLVASGPRYELWSKEFFGPLANVLDEVPILPSIGNHEGDGKNYLFYLQLPGKGRWYSSDLGPVHVLALDFHYEKDSDEQFAFAREDLKKSKAPWKIVYLHYPVFNIGGHNTAWGNSTYLPLFHRAKVDLVVSGHSHIYERFRPIAGREGADAWPITHITTGGGGAPLAPTYPHPALASNYMTNHFVLFEATATTLRGRAIAINNSVLDTFELKKENGQPPSSYFAESYPEDVLKLSWAAAPSLTGGVASSPTSNSTAQVMFTVKPLKSVEPPIQLEITLAPPSAQSYELEQGPLKVIPPRGAEPEKVVWARVRTTGDKKLGIDGRSGDLLSPPLMFQGRLSVGTVETVAYGQRCRISDTATEAAKQLGNGN